MNVTLNSSYQFVSNFFNTVLNNVDTRVKLVVFSAGFFAGMAFFYLAAKLNGYTLHKKISSEKSKKELKPKRPLKIDVSVSSSISNSKKTKLNDSTKSVDSVTHKDSKTDPVSHKIPNPTPDPKLFFTPLRPTKPSSGKPDIHVYCYNAAINEGRISELYMKHYVEKYLNFRSKLKGIPKFHYVKDNDWGNYNQETGKKVAMLFTNCAARLQPQHIVSDIDEVVQKIGNDALAFLMIVFSTTDKKQVPLDSLYEENKLYEGEFMKDFLPNERVALLQRGLDPDICEITNAQHSEGFSKIINQVLGL